MGDGDERDTANEGGERVRDKIREGRERERDRGERQIK